MKSAAAYIVSLAALISALAWVLASGAREHPAAVGPGQNLGDLLNEGLHDPISMVLLQVVIVVACARLAGLLFKKISQPTVIGEMVVGLCLGPSVLGAISPSSANFIFPKASLPNLSILSQIGVILFMFGVGMETDLKQLKNRASSAVLVSFMSIVIPFTLGTLMSLWLFTSYHGDKSSFTAFALFMGVSMSVTAFPVLARILKERALTGTPLGTMVITAAAVDDVTAWCALAIIIALSKAQNATGSLWTMGLTIMVSAIALFVVRPLMRQIAKQGSEESEPTPAAVTAAIVCALGLAFGTQLIGIHSFFGAFLAGLVMPPIPKLRQFLHDRLSYFGALVLVPIFFAFTGLRTNIGLLQSSQDWLVCGAILLVATAGKFGGSYLGARISGMRKTDSTAVGILMNTRGLVELIVLNVGLDLGVLSPRIFSMLVIMAITTTLMTGPLLSLLKLRHPDLIGEPLQEEPIPVL